ncbi:hypothetical protein B0A49_05286 [Cryomyces minteri]|uniref:Uncharacterized protein n=1 Tax=Cryomyces minteri TaxID=331657 RepID=A0A4V5NHB5_9PEZI|nr:hypothetical protein B0A49_05286 [Cryomyces minteri]
MAPFGENMMPSARVSGVSWSMPQRTICTNSTVVLLPTPVTTTSSETCKASCTFRPACLTSQLWQAPSFNQQTITAATILFVVNNRTNATRTTTVFNTELGGHTLPRLNAAGTQIWTTYDYDPLAKVNSTITIVPEPGLSAREHYDINGAKYVLCYANHSNYGSPDEFAFHNGINYSDCNLRTHPSESFPSHETKRDKCISGNPFVNDRICDTPGNSNFSPYRTLEHYSFSDSQC